MASVKVIQSSPCQSIQVSPYFLSPRYRGGIANHPHLCFLPCVDLSLWAYSHSSCHTCWINPDSCQGLNSLRDLDPAHGSNNDTNLHLSSAHYKPGIATCADQNSVLWFSKQTCAVCILLSRWRNWGLSLNPLSEVTQAQSGRGGI